MSGGTGHPETRAARLARATRRLAAAGVPEPGRDARLLLREAAGLAAAELALALREVPDAAEAGRFEALVAGRAERRPVAQLLGRRLFWGRAFRVTADVLDPRPETETIVAAALARGPRARVLDLGTGSGCLLLTLLAEWPEALGLGIDASPAALEVARENAAALGLADRAAFRAGDWLAGAGAGWDCIVANPPYIPEAELAGLAPEVRDHEPRLALTPGGDGLGAFRRIAPALGAALAPGGLALLEFGAGQGEAVRAILAAAGLGGLALLPDLDGRPRVLMVQA